MLSLKAQRNRENDSQKEIGKMINRITAGNIYTGMNNMIGYWYLSMSKPLPTL